MPLLLLTLNTPLDLLICLTNSLSENAYPILTPASPATFDNVLKIIVFFFF